MREQPYFEPWSPSLAREAIRHELWRAETGRCGAVRRLALAESFASEREYVEYYFEHLGPAPAPWRGAGRFLG